MLITRCGNTGEDRAIPEGRHMGRRGGEQLLIGNLQLASLLDTIHLLLIQRARVSVSHINISPLRGAAIRGQQLNAVRLKLKRGRSNRFVHISIYACIYLPTYITHITVAWSCEFEVNN